MDSGTSGGGDSLSDRQYLEEGFGDIDFNDPAWAAFQTTTRSQQGGDYNNPAWFTTTQTGQGGNDTDPASYTTTQSQRSGNTGNIAMASSPTAADSFPGIDFNDTGYLDSVLATFDDEIKREKQKDTGNIATTSSGSAADSFPGIDFNDTKYLDSVLATFDDEIKREKLKEKHRTHYNRYKDNPRWRESKRLDDLVRQGRISKEEATEKKASLATIEVFVRDTPDARASGNRGFVDTRCDRCRLYGKLVAECTGAPCTECVKHNEVCSKYSAAPVSLDPFSYTQGPSYWDHPYGGGGAGGGGFGDGGGGFGAAEQTHY